MLGGVAEDRCRNYSFATALSIAMYCSWSTLRVREVLGLTLRSIHHGLSRATSCHAGHSSIQYNIHPFITDSIDLHIHDMKQRITYLLRDAHQHGGVDPSTLKVGTDSLSIPGLDAAKEWRITIGVKELPQEACGFPKNCMNRYMSS